MAVFGVQGVNGAGKTAFAVQELWEKYKNGRRIFSTTPLIDTRTNLKTGFPVNTRTYGKPWAKHIKTFEELLAVTNGEVLLDEGDGWFDARKWAGLTDERRRYFTQHRKNGLNIWITAPDVDNLDKVIRGLFWVVYHIGSWSQAIPLGGGRYIPGLSIVRGFNPARTSLTGKKTIESVRILWLRPEIFNLYDTAFRVGDGAGLANSKGAGTRYVLSGLGALRPIDLGAEQVGTRWKRICDIDPATGIGRVRYSVLPPPLVDDDSKDGLTLMGEDGLVDDAVPWAWAEKAERSLTRNYK